MKLNLLPKAPSRQRSGVVLAVLCALSALLLAPGASADRAVVPASAGVTDGDASHQTPIELLAGKIASHIAGHAVTVDCNSRSSWARIVLQTGGNPSAEAGTVATQWDGSTGHLISISTVAELSNVVCQPLAQFAAAATKTTDCADRTTLAVAKPSVGACRQGGATHVKLSAAFWSRYSQTAVAILTLAHESIHLGGIVGGKLSNGLAVGDQQAEAKADCYGMQWMPYVAQQLGDSPAGARALEAYVWNTIYPLSRTANPAYWSAQCRAGGTLDERAPGAGLWP